MNIGNMDTKIIENFIVCLLPFHNSIEKFVEMR